MKQPIWSLALFAFFPIHKSGFYFQKVKDRPQIYKREIPELPSFLFREWFELGGSSSGAHVTCIYSGLRVKSKHALNATQHANIVEAFALHLFLCGRQKSEDPKFEPHG